MKQFTGRIPGKNPAWVKLCLEHFDGIFIYQEKYMIRRKASSREEGLSSGEIQAFGCQEQHSGIYEWIPSALWAPSTWPIGERHLSFQMDESLRNDDVTYWDVRIYDPIGLHLSMAANHYPTTGRYNFLKNRVKLLDQLKTGSYIAKGERRRKDVDIPSKFWTSPNIEEWINWDNSSCRDYKLIRVRPSDPPSPDTDMRPDHGLSGVAAYADRKKLDWGRRHLVGKFHVEHAKKLRQQQPETEWPPARVWLAAYVRDTSSPEGMYKEEYLPKIREILGGKKGPVSRKGGPKAADRDPGKWSIPACPWEELPKKS